MRYKILVFVLIIGALGTTFLVFKSDIIGLTDQGRALIANDPSVAAFKHDAVALEQQVFTTEPLKLATGVDTGKLTDSGVINLTNKERQLQNVALLKESTILDKSAQAKLNDMFAKQYFEHVSPSGKGPADIDTAAGYTFVIVGENLALGNFGSDAALLDGWMNSPGHRANILRPGYKEIGVAVGEGNYQGKKTWLAVQEFGTPSSVCSVIDTRLAAEIDSGKIALKNKEADLSARETAINQYEPKNGATYNHMIDDYNQHVAEYNTLVTLIKKDIGTYNLEAQNYNTCLASFSKN